MTMLGEREASAGGIEAPLLVQSACLLGGCEKLRKAEAEKEKSSLNALVECVDQQLGWLLTRLIAFG